MARARASEGASTVISILWLVLVAALALVPAAAQIALDDQVREIASGLRCPVCQNLSVADSPSEMAQQMRALIRERLAAGQSREEIEAYFVSKYGQWILLAPKKSGLNLLLWLGPFVGAALGLFVAARCARRWARGWVARPAPAADTALVDRIRAEVADEAAFPASRELESTSPLDRERARLREALRELAFDHRAGKLSDVDYQAMRDEYEARAVGVLRELEAEAARALEAEGARVRPKAHAEVAPGAAPQRRRPVRAALAGAFLLVFGLALGVFLAQGIRPRGAMDSPTGDFLTGTGPGGLSGSLASRRTDVERELQEGQAALARQDLRMAVDHFKRVLDADPNNATALAFLGTVLWQIGHADPALQALDRALAAAPDHPLALWVKGFVLSEGKQDYAGAVRTWEALARLPLPPEDARVVTGRLAEARARLAAGPAAPVSPAPAVQAPGAPPPAAASGSRGERRISGTVELARGADEPAGILFLIARKRARGPPLAVKRIANPKFPLAFSLGPEDVMVAGAAFEGPLTVIARLKRDGRAGPAVAGDLEGVATRNPVAVGTDGVRIRLEPVRR